MKAKATKQLKKAKPVVQLKDLKPQKDPRGGRRVDWVEGHVTEVKFPK